MNYYRYIGRRALDIRYIRSRVQKLFSVMSDKDYDLLQDLLIQAENVLKKYL